MDLKDLLNVDFLNFNSLAKIDECYQVAGVSSRRELFSKLYTCLNQIEEQEKALHVADKDLLFFYMGLYPERLGGNYTLPPYDLQALASSYTKTTWLVLCSYYSLKSIKHNSGWVRHYKNQLIDLVDKCKDMTALEICIELKKSQAYSLYELGINGAWQGPEAAQDVLDDFGREYLVRLWGLHDNRDIGVKNIILSVKFRQIRNRYIGLIKGKNARAIK